MGIKRFIYNRLFNKRQRFAIWQAVLFSEYAYRRRGNVDGAAYVRTVINEVAPIAATKQRLFTADEVDAIVKARVSEVIKPTDTDKPSEDVDEAGDSEENKK